MGKHFYHTVTITGNLDRKPGKADYEFARNEFSRICMKAGLKAEIMCTELVEKGIKWNFRIEYRADMSLAEADQKSQNRLLDAILEKLDDGSAVLAKWGYQPSDILDHRDVVVHRQNRIVMMCEQTLYAPGIVDLTVAILGMVDTTIEMGVDKGDIMISDPYQRYGMYCTDISHPMPMLEEENLSNMLG